MMLSRCWSDCTGVAQRMCKYFNLDLCPEVYVLCLAETVAITTSCYAKIQGTELLLYGQN